MAILYFFADNLKKSNHQAYVVGSDSALVIVPILFMHVSDWFISHVWIFIYLFGSAILLLFILCTMYSSNFALLFNFRGFYLIGLHDHQ